jgi:hypothetical protein
MARGSLLSSLGAIAVLAGMATLASAADPAPRAFAPDVLSAPHGVDCLTFTPDGNTVFFDREGANASTIMTSHRVDGRWSEPQVAPFSGRWVDHDPVVAPDGSYLIFTSNRPVVAGGGPLRGGQLWRVDRNGGWASPVRLPAIVNFGTQIYAPSVAANGDVYFQSADNPAHRFHIYRAAWRSGHFQKPVPLRIAPAGTYEQDPAVAPDGSFIVFDYGYATAHQPQRLYIAYRRGDGWSPPVDFGDTVNRLQPWGAHLGPDGQTLYVTSDVEVGTGDQRGNHIWSLELAGRLRTRGKTAADPVGTPSVAGSSSVYLAPAVTPGDRLDTIFSKAVAITGADFDPLVRRISGTASDEVTTVAADAITLHEQYLYDGRPAGSGTVTIRNHGITDCDARNKCTTNDSTSASIFDSLLWGPAPDEFAAGSTWSSNVKTSWEIGPPGKEEISVVRLDPGLGLITLAREGSGTGSSSDDAVLNTFTIASHGRSIKVKLIPGPATWHGRATFIHGVTLADEIMLTRSVQLVSDKGQVFHGTERIYTLFTEG